MTGDNGMSPERLARLFTELSERKGARMVREDGRGGYRWTGKGWEVRSDDRWVPTRVVVWDLGAGWTVLGDGETVPEPETEDTSAYSVDMPLYAVSERYPPSSRDDLCDLCAQADTCDRGECGGFRPARTGSDADRIRADGRGL